ncbi:MAG TPA: SRPBCC domain-containing protein [Polyangiaceae bacterium]|nr:SRPBCC domain-containing protein [Polyangiaceae bacterium]
MTAKPPASTISITTPSDHELSWSRRFRAPIARVFEALTRPELVRRWLLGPEGWSMPVCEIDLRPGGRYRYVWRRDRDGQEMGMGGVFEEVSAPTHVTFTEVFDEAWYAGHALGRYQLVDEGATTLLVQTMKYESREVRDGVLRSGFEAGIEKSHERLEAIFSE